MKSHVVYLDTNFINRLADPPEARRDKRKQHRTSREWWDAYRRRAILITSPYTFQKSILQYKGDPKNKRLRQRRFRHITIVRPPAREVDKLARTLRKPHGPIPADEVLDSQHVAVAALVGCPHILTWNITHSPTPSAINCWIKFLERPTMQRRKLEPRLSSSPRRPSRRRIADTDRVADERAVRRRIAEAFNFDDQRITEAAYAAPIPPGIRVLDVPPNYFRHPENDTE